MLTVIVITLPDAEVADEARRITAMLDSGAVHRVHLRKPGLSAEELGRLVEAIPQRLHCRLTLHSCPELTHRYPGLGYHFSASRPEVRPSEGMVSRSCHTPAEAALWAPRVDYVTLSPVFDSISKQGYCAALFDPEAEREALRAGHVVALGGVTPDKFPGLRSRGYSGAAMLGHAWTTDLQTFIAQLKCYNS